MSYLPNPSADFELAPAGTHHAVCYRVIDLGTQETNFEGKIDKKHQILVSWELPDEPMKDGRPFGIGKTYTWSMNKRASLRKHLEAWRGVPFSDKDFGPNGFNIKNILGKCCTVSIVHGERNDGSQNARVDSVGKAMKGHVQTPPTNTCIYLWLDDIGWDTNIFALLPEWLQEKITASPEYENIITGRPAEKAADERNPPGDQSEDIPF
jgi:hypothetical protein